jgi:putative membrane protein
VLVPTARMQSVSLRQGPLLRMLRLAEINVHTVTGPIRATLGALDARDGSRFFQEVAASAVAAAAADRSHRWRDARPDLDGLDQQVSGLDRLDQRGAQGEALRTSPNLSGGPA